MLNRLLRSTIINANKVRLKGRFAGFQGAGQQRPRGSQQDGGKSDGREDGRGKEEQRYKSYFGAKGRGVWYASGSQYILGVSMAFHKFEELKREGKSEYVPLQGRVETLTDHGYGTVLLTPEQALRDITGDPMHKIDELRLILRFIEIGIYFLPTILTFPMVFVPGLDALWWRMVLSTVQFSGPCWIKFGQWMSTRPDLFPKLLCDKFSLLHNSCPSHSFEVTEATVRDNFGISDLRERFLYFEEDPIASGAIAQVHKAVDYDGDVVVVKVLHPNVKKNIETDITIIYSVLWTFAQLPDMKWLSLPESVIEFGKSMTKQVDLAEEGEHLARFIKNFEGNTEVIFPRPKASAPAVLVESFEPGLPIMNFIKSNNVHNPALARIGLNAYMQMMLIDNFIHADLHPGNVMVRAPQDISAAAASSVDPSLKEYWEIVNQRLEAFDPMKVLIKEDLKIPSTKPPRLVLLDVGLVTQLNKTDKDHFRELFTEVLKGNGKAGAELIIKYSREAQCTEQEMHEFKEKLGALFDSVQHSKISDVHIGHIMGDTLSLVREYHVKIESNFATLVMGTIILEGLGKQLDPNLSLLKAAIPFLLTRPTSGFFTGFFKYLITPQNVTQEETIPPQSQPNTDTKNKSKS